MQSNTTKAGIIQYCILPLKKILIPNIQSFQNLGESTMQKIPPIEDKILVVTVSVTNLTRRVKGLQKAYDYLSNISGHYDYTIRDFNTRKVVERGRI
jgi:hypothetical protein